MNVKVDTQPNLWQYWTVEMNVKRDKTIDTTEFWINRTVDIRWECKTRSDYLIFDTV